MPDEIEQYIQAASAEPAMEESAIFDAVVDIVVDGDYDYYIYDLVPLGHALYYLSMAKVYDEWINRITKLREEMREHEEMVARIKRQKVTEEDHILTELQYIKNRINQSSSILTDRDKTAFFFVVVPEEMIILDTQKAAQLFAKFDVPDRRLRGQPRAAARTLPARRFPPYLQNRLKMQGRYLEEIDKTFGKQVIARVPELERDVTGLKMIEKLAEPDVRQRKREALTYAGDQDITHANSLTEHPQLKFTFFGGKGGVGKTVMAGVTALHLARQGKRTSCWPPPTRCTRLSGLLDQDVYGKPTAGQQRAQPVGVRDRHQGDHRALQAGHQAEDPLVPEVRRDLHAGRRVRRERHHEPGVRRVGHVREHGGPDVQERVRRLRLRHRAHRQRAPPARHEQGVLALGEQDGEVARGGAVAARAVLVHQEERSRTR